ncbi:GAF domain-containing protein [Streptomyces sp. NPDC048639]|uniref:GAF domain-containing protein n=1 Tax=Streptomyces sp. NPDC048639 TaxID=3365581 RepID=UPI003724A79C
MDSYQSWLTKFLATQDGVAGTVHLVRGDLLEITAAVNIPESVQTATRVIQPGKGMAGLAWSRRQPVQTCNLREDTTGDVSPGACAVAAQAAVALPVPDGAGEVRAVVGIAFASEREIEMWELDRLSGAVVSLP